jgi:phage terminase large subunit-like protein
MDFGDVKAVVAECMDRYRVTRCYFDPIFVASLLDDLTLEFGEDKMYRWATNRTVAMGAAVERTYVAVVTGEGLRHDGGTKLTEHVLNARTRMSNGRTQIAKDAPRSPRKIDAAVAMVLAVEAASDSRLAGEDIVVPVSRRAWSF